MQKCPNCGELTFGKFANINIGPAISKQCSSCGANISTPYSSMALYLPMIIAILFAKILLPSPLNWIIAIVLGILTLYIGWKRVPLIVKSK